MWTILFIIAAIALFFGLIISLLSGEEKGLRKKITEALPNNNCGACGYPTCEEYAKAIEKDSSLVGKCVIATDESNEKLKQLLGVDVKISKKTAKVLCEGKSEKYAEYHGYKSCAAMKLFSPFKCPKMCMGFGDCKRACDYDAISIENGIASIDKNKCVGCGKCEKACPIHIIKNVAKRKAYIKCSEGKNSCKKGCTGCGLCVNHCPSKAITMQGKLAVIDEGKCTGCGICVKKCPRKVLSCEL